MLCDQCVDVNCEIGYGTLVFFKHAESETPFDWFVLYFSLVYGLTTDHDVSFFS